MKSDEGLLNAPPPAAPGVGAEPAAPLPAVVVEVPVPEVAAPEVPVPAPFEAPAPVPVVASGFLRLIADLRAGSLRSAKKSGASAATAALFGVSLLLGMRGEAVADPEVATPITRTRSEMAIQGWKVRIDIRLVQAQHRDPGRRALQLLEAQLADINAVTAAEPLAKLRSVAIVLDLDHGTLDRTQYHPSADWLRQHGYAPDLAKCVHIPVASGFISPRTHHEQPWCVLHELAHAYHDQVLGFDEPRLVEAWEHYKATGAGESVLHISGSQTKHYALTDPMEFFAEMSEAYFGMNDFFPFNRAELKSAQPEVFELLRTIWGPTP